MNTIKAKLEDWYDDLKWYTRHYRGNIRCYINGLKRWFSYYKVLMSVYDFDYSSIIEVERKQITRVRDSVTKYHSHVNWERDVDRMNLALKLLDIIREDGRVEFIGNNFKVREDGLLLIDPESRWVLDVYVNTRNASRFFKNWMPDFDDPITGPLWKDHLRVEKAWNLYYKLRTQYTRHWWD